MATRSDQLHSHQFTLQRVVGALAMRDPDPVSSPMRRIGGALFASIMIAALAVAAVGIYGVIKPTGGDGWRNGDVLIIEEETGARYVYRDDKLFPVLNYSSALLILGQAEPKVQSVPRAELVGVPRGTPLGIVGAPDPLPAASAVVTAAWTLCSRPAATGTPPESVLSVGSSPTAAALGDEGLLASDPAGALHLLWHNRRYAIAQPDLFVGAFTWPKASAVPMAPAVLNAIPAGKELRSLDIVRTEKASAVGGFKVGEVFVVKSQGGSSVFGVALEGGVADITQVQADLLIAKGNNGGGSAREMGQAQYAAAVALASLVPQGDGAPPEKTPVQARLTSKGGVCATFADATTAAAISLAETVPPIAGEVRAVRGSTDTAASQGASTVDWIAVPAGRAAVVEALAGPTSPSGSLGIVSDLGLRFPVASRDVLTVLGYATVTPQRLPAALVALVPAGRALDQAAAMLPATSGV